MSRIVQISGIEFTLNGHQKSGEIGIMAGKKITKFKSSKGQLKKKAMTSTIIKNSAHSNPMPSHAQVTKSQQNIPPNAILTLPGVPVPVKQNPIPPTQPSRDQLQPPNLTPPAQSQFVPAPTLGSVTGARPVNNMNLGQSVLNARTIQGGAVHKAQAKTKTKTQSTLPSAQPLQESVEKQLELKTEELTDQVILLSEITDSLLDESWTPDGITDILHVLLCSLNLDVITVVLPSMNYPTVLDNISSRGYDISPKSNVVNLWLKTFDENSGIDWKKLLKLAKDIKTDLAYWVVQEELHSIGYVPIRDERIIYGFLFVAAKSKKEQSHLTSPLLEICGTLIGLSYAKKFTSGK